MYIGIDLTDSQIKKVVQSYIILDDLLKELMDDIDYPKNKIERHLDDAWGELYTTILNIMTHKKLPDTSNESLHKLIKEISKEE